MDSETIIKGLERARRDTEDVGLNAVFVTHEVIDVIIDTLREKNQQPKTGHWLKKMSSYPSANAMGGSRASTCDLCGGWGRKTFKYCPHCGAKMEEQTRT